MKDAGIKNTEERLLCVLTSPKEEQQTFGVSVYAVGADKPHRVFQAVSPRSEISGFLKLLQDGGVLCGHTACKSDNADPCADAGHM